MHDNKATLAALKVPYRTVLHVKWYNFSKNVPCQTYVHVKYRNKCLQPKINSFFYTKHVEKTILILQNYCSLRQQPRILLTSF